jgi:hypothetical protein
MGKDCGQSQQAHTIGGGVPSTGGIIPGWENCPTALSSIANTTLIYLELNRRFHAQKPVGNQMIYSKNQSQRSAESQKV